VSKFVCLVVDATVKITNRSHSKDLNVKIFQLYQDERIAIDAWRTHLGGKRMTISSLFRMAIILVELKEIDLNNSHVILQNLDAPHHTLKSKCRSSSASDSEISPTNITGVYACDMKILDRAIPGKDQAVQIRSLLYALAEYLDYDLAGKVKERAKKRRAAKKARRTLVRQ